MEMRAVDIQSKGRSARKSHEVSEVLMGQRTWLSSVGLSQGGS